MDLIVIATRGYTGLKHFLLGSTTEEGAGLLFIKTPPRARRSFLSGHSSRRRTSHPRLSLFRQAKE